MSTILTAETEATLDRIASMSTLTREQVLTQAVESYAKWLEYETAKIEEARADIAAGRYIDHDVLFDELEKRYAD